MKRNVLVYEKGCDICKEKEWIGLKSDLKYLLLIGTTNASQILSKECRDHIFGVRYKDIEICMKCFEILVGLENHFDKLWPDFIQNEKAKKIVHNIVSNPDLLKKALEFRSKGKYLPTEIIEEALSSK